MSLDDDLRNFSRIQIFAVLEPEAQRLLAFSCETKLLRSGDVLFCAGEQSDGGYVVLNGSISLGSEREVHKQTVRPVALIGEIAIISQTERIATATVREPTEVFKVSRMLFHRVLKEYPQSAFRVRELIASRLRGISDQLEAARTTMLK